MQTNAGTDPGRSFAERILSEMKGMRQEMDTLTMQVSILNECAGLLLRPWDEENESPVQAIMRLMGLLVSGTEETHRRLEAVTTTLIDGRMAAALRASMDT